MKKTYFMFLESSPFPMISFLLVNSLFFNMILLFKKFKSNLFLINIFILMTISKKWMLKNKFESTNQGFHSKKNLKMLKLGMILFISTEIMLFFSLFWSYLNSSLSPNIEMGSSWPPMNIFSSNPNLFPLYGSILLIYSGIFITFMHKNMMKNKFLKSKKQLLLTILMGILFIDMQMSEYTFSNFIFNSMNDSNFMNFFFFITSAHGSHVMVGILLMMWSMKFIKKKNISMKDNSSIEITAWYWHFVDIIWLFVYTMLYWMNF